MVKVSSSEVCDRTWVLFPQGAETSCHPWAITELVSSLTCVLNISELSILLLL